MIGIHDKIDHVVSTSSVERGKPCPDVYLYVCDKLGVEPGSAIAVEDAPFGIMSAYDAGCRVIMVPDLTEPDEDLRSKTVYVASSLDNLVPFFDGILG